MYDADNEKKRQGDIAQAKKNAAVQPFWKDFNEGISQKGKVIDPDRTASVPSHKV